MRVMHFRKKRILAAVLAMVMLLTMAAPAYAAKKDEAAVNTEKAALEVVQIADAAAFAAIAQECAVQDYSTGKAFMLTADIDLTEYENLVIPYMDGIFDGKNHTITGLVLSDDSSDLGLFRYVGVNGAVVNLNVEGEVVTSDDQQHVGIMCGTNKGILRNLTVKGSISSRAQVGGLVGFNEETGTVRNCKNYAAVDGRYQTGGIAGYNEGVIADSENEGAINKSSKVKKKTPDGEGDAVNISIPNAVVGVAADDRANETGGIVGNNKGKVSYCNNKGIVGAKNLGSCSGGIVGRSAGSLVGCENSGNVFGRLNVGGIAGFVDPYKEKQLDEDYISELEDEIDDMKSALDGVKEAGKNLSNNLNDNAETIQNSIRNLKDTVRGYLDAYDSDFDSTRSKLSDEADSIEDTVDDMDYNFRLKKLGEALEDLRSEISEIEKLVRQLKQFADESADILSKDAAAKINETIEKYNAILKKLEAFSAQIEALKKLIASGQPVADAYTGISVGSTPKAGTVSENSAAAIAAYKQATEIISKIEKHYANALVYVDDIGRIVEKWPKEAKKVKNDIKDIKNDIEDVRDISSDYLDVLSGRTDSFRAEVRPKMDELSDEAENTRKILKNDWDEVTDRLDTLHDCFDKMRTTVRNGRDDLKQIKEDKSVYVDVSESILLTEGEGRILYCVNNGEIQAKNSVGGIVGAIDISDVKDNAIDIFEKYKNMNNDDDDDDEEEDNDDALIKHVQSLVYACENNGYIYSDDDYVGGIAGKAAYGLLSGCENYADIESDDGKYAGGIAGNSKLTITGCYSLGGVKAKSYMGGIAGKAENISNCYDCSYMDTDNASVKSYGAIAGSAKGVVTGNYFVDNGFGAVDCVTLSGQATGLKYAAFMRLSNIPDRFANFTVKFVDDGNLLQAMNFKYGDELAVSDYPELEQREGEYAYWEEKEISPVCRNVTMHSVRRVYVPAVASFGADEKYEGKSLLVVSGDFYPDTKLFAKEAEGAGKEAAEKVKESVYSDIHYVTLKVYDYSIEQQEEFNKEVELRALAGAIPANTMLVLDSAGNVVTSLENLEMKNSYVDAKLTLPSSGTILLIQHVSRVTVAAVIMTLLIIIAVIVVLKLFFKKRKGKRRKH